MSEKKEWKKVYITFRSRIYETRAACILYCGNLIFLLFFFFAEALPHPVHKTVRGHQKSTQIPSEIEQIPPSILIYEKEFLL